MLSKDTRFENDGIGPQTQIRYGADFLYYKRHSTELHHSPDSTLWVQALLRTWDRELFANHNQRKGSLQATTTPRQLKSEKTSMETRLQKT